MTALLTQVLEEVQTLSEEAQDSLAAILLEEIEADAKWNESFRKSKDVLERMGREGLRQHAAGETVETDFEDL